MHLDTARFGEIDVEPDRILRAADGFPGFDHLVRFALIEVEEDAGLVWLQSLDDGDVAFLGAAAFEFYPDYAFEVADVDEAALGHPDPDELTVIVLLTVDRDAEAITANLLAPVLINRAENLLRQVVLDADQPLHAPFGARS